MAERKMLKTSERKKSGLVPDTGAATPSEPVAKSSRRRSKGGDGNSTSKSTHSVRGRMRRAVVKPLKKTKRSDENTRGFWELHQFQEWRFVRVINDEAVDEAEDEAAEDAEDRTS